MKNFYTLIIVFLCVNIAIAQTVIDVASGNGTLELAIKNANNGDILQLTGGAEYALSSSATTFGTIGKKITIQVNPASSEKALLKLNASSSKTKKYYFFIVKDGADLTLKGLEIHGLLNGETVAGSMILMDGSPNPVNARIKNFKFENCIFHDFIDNIVHGMKDDIARGMIQDSVFVNNTIVYNAQHFLQYKHVSLHHVEIKNSTVYKMQGMALKIGKIGYRCTLLNSRKPYIPTSDATITPTGFIDHCTFDDLGDIHGHVQVDDAYALLKVTNSIISNQQQYKQPALYFLEPHINTAVEIENTCFWACAPPNAEVGYGAWNGYRFVNTITTDPEYANPNEGDFTLPVYSPLLSFGSKGDAIGDPRWAPSSPLVLSLPSVVEKSDKIDKSVSAFTNYPNPVKTFTNFKYLVHTKANVVLKIFDSQGREVKTIVNEMKRPGEHFVKWDAEVVGNGIYLAYFQCGDFKIIRKVIVSN